MSTLELAMPIELELLDPVHQALDKQPYVKMY